MADRRELLLAAAKTALEEAVILPTSGPFVTLDEYPVSNYGGGAYQLAVNHNPSAGFQSIQFDDGALVTDVSFYLQRDGAPTGNVVAKIYAATGTHGSTAKPTGAALGTSAAVNVTTISDASPALVEFTFETPFEMEAGETYCIACEFDGGDASNTLRLGVDVTGPTHEGSSGTRDDVGAWHDTAGAQDLIFTLTGVEPVAKPEGLQVYRHLARQADANLLPDISVLYLGEELIDSATASVDRNVRVGLRCRAQALSSESGDAALIEVLLWGELALLAVDYELGGIAANARLEGIAQIAAEEHADVWAEALMTFLFTIRTKWGDPRQAP